MFKSNNIKHDELKNPWSKSLEHFQTKERIVTEKREILESQLGFILQAICKSGATNEADVFVI
jgi:hypothetical protein